MPKKKDKKKVQWKMGPESLGAAIKETAMRLGLTTGQGLRGKQIDTAVDKVTGARKRRDEKPKKGRR